MSVPIIYPQPIEMAIAQIELLLAHDAGLSPHEPERFSLRSLALLVLQQDRVLWEQLEQNNGLIHQIESIIVEAQNHLDQPIALTIAQTRQEQAWQLESSVMEVPSKFQTPWAERLHYITVNPLTGFPLLIIVLYFALYKFVGEFGAGTLVDGIESFFDARINPLVNSITQTFIPWTPLQDLIANDYGIITLGIRYAIAIVLPVVGTYFLVFSVLEDSGYLPRLSLMLDRLFKSIGLSGRAVIPMVLGLGCDTMATVVTRTLETRRERILSVFLLSLAIPCAAQWGVILGLLAQKPLALTLWAGVIILVFLGVGHLAAQVIPGQRASFYMEIPPLRFPKLTNILTKTYVRMKAYVWEIIPLFIWASVLIWLGQLTGLFQWIIQTMEPLCRWLNLPQESASIFLYGFFRRDYGAAGLFDLYQNGVFSTNQLIVMAVILTLFLPCIAQLQVMIKEQGLKVSAAIVAFIFPFAFLVGYGLNTLLNLLGVMV